MRAYPPAANTEYALKAPTFPIQITFVRNAEIVLTVTISAKTAKLVLTAVLQTVKTPAVNTVYVQTAPIGTIISVRTVKRV